MEEKILEVLSRIEKKIDSQKCFTDTKGIIKKCDSLGRVTLPIAIRRELDIDENTSLKVLCTNGKIIIEKSDL